MYYVSNKMHPRFCLHFMMIVGVMKAVEAVTAELARMSRPVTTPEEIAQVISIIKCMRACTY